MNTNDSSAKVLVAVVVIGLIIGGVFLLLTLTRQAEVNDYASCLEAGHPTVEIGTQKKCMAPGQSFVKQ